MDFLFKNTMIGIVVGSLLAFLGLVSHHTMATVMLIPTAPSIEAKAYILKDFSSNRTLLEKNADQRIEPASLTKLMTAYLVFQALQTKRFQPTDMVTISENAWRSEGSRMYLELNSTVPVELLIKGMVIQSGNDACVALAEFIAGSEAAFVLLMNQRAQELGLTGTHYMNSTGLPDEQHYSTVRDLAKMAKALIRDFPDHYRLYSEREFTYNNITQYNRNLLLWRDSTVDGVKTGYTENAGYCLISSAKRGNMRLVGVLTGSESLKARATESQKMLDYGFNFFDTYLLYKAREPLSVEKVWQGRVDKLQLGLKAPLYVTIPKGQYTQLNATLHVSNQQIIAPVIANEDYGKLKIQLGNQLIAEQPLIALHPVEIGSLWQQFVDYLLLKFQ